MQKDEVPEEVHKFVREMYEGPIATLDGRGDTDEAIRSFAADVSGSGIKMRSFLGDTFVKAFKTLVQDMASTKGETEVVQDNCLWHLLNGLGFGSGQLEMRYRIAVFKSFV